MRTATADFGLSGAAPPRPAGGDRPATGTLSFALTIAFLVALLANLPLVFPASARFAPAQLLATAGLAMLFVERAIARRPFTVVWPESHFLLAFLGIAAVSSVTALWPGFAVENTLKLAKLVAVCLLLVNTLDTWRRFERASATLALAALIPALGAIVAFQRGDVVEGRAHWLGTFANPNDLAFTLVVLLPLLVALAANSSGVRRVVFGAAIAIQLWAIFLTYSRGGMVGLAVVLGLVGLTWAGPWLRVPILFLLAAGFLFAVTEYWDRGQGFENLDADRTFEQRFETIQIGLAMAADRPLLGVGPGCSVVGFERYGPSGKVGERALVTHNTPVQALAETGALGFVAFGLLVAFALRRVRRLAREHRRAGDRRRFRTISAVEISLWAFLVCGLAGGYLWSWYPFLLLGLASATRNLPAPDVIQPDPDRFGRIPCAASPAY